MSFENLLCLVFWILVDSAAVRSLWKLAVLLRSYSEKEEKGDNYEIKKTN